jgi:hypothetical protein
MSAPTGLIGYVANDGVMHAIGKVYGVEPDELVVCLEPACTWAAADWSRRLHDAEARELIREERS